MIKEIGKYKQKLESKIKDSKSDYSGIDNYFYGYDCALEKVVKDLDKIIKRERQKDGRENY